MSQSKALYRLQTLDLGIESRRTASCARLRPMLRLLKTSFAPKKPACLI